MKILHSISDLSTLGVPLILVPGTFDGVHRGHQALIQRAKEEALSFGGSVVAMTFDRHPAALLRPEKMPLQLSSKVQKLDLLKKYGVDAVLILSFDKKLAAISAEEFIRQLASPENLLKKICIGQQWFFGQGGKGNKELLRLLGEEYGFSLVSLDPVKINNESISSTRLRHLITSAHLYEAAECFGRYYSIVGTIVKGAGRGKQLGFLTANLLITSDQLFPYGVYRVHVKLEEHLFLGVANIGVRPTSEETFSYLEIHLFNFTGDLYDQEIEVEFVAFLRKEKKFSNKDELKKEIAEDVKKAKTFFKK